MYLVIHFENAIHQDMIEYILWSQFGRNLMTTIMTKQGISINFYK